MSGGLRGRITDPAGAAISGAILTLRNRVSPAWPEQSATADDTGTFSLQGIKPGRYIVSVKSDGFKQFSCEVDIGAGARQSLNISLNLEDIQERMVVKDDSVKGDTDPARNGGTMVLKDEDLDRLSDDPDELEQQLRALAVTPGGGSAQLSINGFSASRLPPKASIREIRINQDPFSAEYDSPGLARIEVFTKPGSTQFHGNLSFRYNDAKFNARSPFLTQTPSYQTEQFDTFALGPLSKNLSFAFDYGRHSVNESAATNALILDHHFHPIQFSQAVPNPRLFSAGELRLDYQISPNNTFLANYFHIGIDERNDGVGQFALASQGFDITKAENTIQLSETLFLSSSVVNETRFQYQSVRSRQSALSSVPQVSVLGAFTGGGSNLGNIAISQDRFELQNYTSIAFRAHSIKFGGRLRVAAETDDSTPNLNGTFIFPSLAAFAVTEQGLQQGLAATQIRAEGGGAAQFSVSSGRPRVSDVLVDAGAFVLDNWRIRPNLTLSYGLRYEAQNGIREIGDLAPRFGVAWGIHPKQKISPRDIVRVGFGLFYNRVGQNLLLQTQELNGINQQLFIVRNPDFFPNVPSAARLTNYHTIPTTYQLDPLLRSPLLAQTSFSFERQLPRASKISATYLQSSGVRQLLSANINAPLLGTFDPSKPTSGVRPLPNEGNIYQYQSRGRFQENQLLVNFVTSSLSRVQLSGGYVLDYAKSNTSGPTSFATNQFNLEQDYGRSSYDVRNRFHLSGRLDLPIGFLLNGILLVRSGQPYNITTDQDLNGDSIFNDRPAFATDLSRPSVVRTRLGTFETSPLPGQTIIPPFLGTGPANATLNLRLMRAIALGNTEIGTGSTGGTHSTGDATGGPQDSSVFRQAWNPQYTIRFEVFANNIFNHVNLAPPVGTLDSPLFGRSIVLAGSPYSQTSATRQIVLRVVFSF